MPLSKDYFNKNTNTLKLLSKETIDDLVNIFRSEKHKIILKKIPLILNIYPKEYILYYLKGLSHAKLGNFSNAILDLKIALKLNPNNHEIYNHIGLCYYHTNNLKKAKFYYQSGLKLKNDNFNLITNLANLLKEENSFDQALMLYIKSLTLENSNKWGIYYNIGLIYLAKKNISKAIENFEISIKINPYYSKTYLELGNIYQISGKDLLAQSFYKQAILLDKNCANAYHRLADNQKKLNQLDQALINYEIATNLNPHSDYLLGYSTFIKMKLCLWEDIENSKSELITGINAGKKVSTPFMIQALIDDPNIQKKASEIFSKNQHSNINKFPSNKIFKKHKKIRVGYFSPDFSNHPIAFLTSEMYGLHDRNNFEIYAFSFGLDNRDDFNIRIIEGVDKYFNVRLMSDEEIVNLAMSNEIDIAIDLTGYTRGNRSSIFAMRVAPIQISYAGFLGPMGKNCHDYLIADEIIIENQNKKFFHEKIIFLPSYQVNQSYKPISIENVNKSTYNLPKKSFVFGCFNSSYKISPETFHTWTKILKNVDESILFLIENNEITKRNLKKEAQKRGVNPNRIIFGEHLPRAEHFKRYHLVDLFLDTHPYNGGTTTSDALSMGLPVITFQGKSFSSRLCSSILNSANLNELITDSRKKYILLATELALKENKLKNIKNKLINNLSSSKLYNPKNFTRSLENAFQIAYEQKKNGKSYNHIYIK